MTEQTLTGIKSHMKQIEDLGSVVSTMKSLAAVNISHFEEAASAADLYFNNIRLALQILMINQPPGVKFGYSKKPGLIIIVIGSDQGMVGQFNETVAEKTKEDIEDLKKQENIEQQASKQRLICLGHRMETSLYNVGLDIDKTLEMAENLTDVIEVVIGMLSYINKSFPNGIPSVYVINNRPEGGSTYSTSNNRILPLDRDMLENLKYKKWKGISIPDIRSDWTKLFQKISREYLLNSLYVSVVESLTSENAARLSAMQAAEKNIEEKKDEVQALYNQKRQSAITAELLDIVGGFEALK